MARKGGRSTTIASIGYLNLLGKTVVCFFQALTAVANTRPLSHRLQVELWERKTALYPLQFRVFRGLLIAIRHSACVDRPDVVLKSTVLHATVDYFSAPMHEALQGHRSIWVASKELIPNT